MTRSDFNWPVPHPAVKLFSASCIYIPDGESHRDYSDRHVMIPSPLFRQFMEIWRPVFEAPEELAMRMKRLRMGNWDLGSFFRFRLSELALLRRVRFFPYFMFSVHRTGTGARVPLGTYNHEHQLYINYGFEYDSARIIETLVPDDRTWKGMIGPARFFHHRFYLYAFLRTLAEKQQCAKRLHFLRLAQRFVIYLFQPR